MRTRKNSWVLWAAALVSIGIYASNAKAVFYTEQYEMTASPDTVPGTVNGHTLLVATGSGTNGPSGSTFAGGIMTFLDNNLSSGNQGFYIGSGNTGGAWMGASSNFNVDFYMRVLQSNEPSAVVRSPSDSRAATSADCR